MSLYRTIKFLIISALFITGLNTIYLPKVSALSAVQLLASNRPQSGTNGLTPLSYPQFYNNNVLFSTYSPNSLRSYWNIIYPDGAGGYSFGEPALTGDYVANPSSAVNESGYSAADLNGDGTEDLGLSLFHKAGDDPRSYKTAIEYSSGDKYLTPYGDSEYCNPGNSGASKMRSPAIADIDHDGQPDVLGGAGCNLYRMNKSGALAQTISAYSIVPYSDSHFLHNSVIADYSGDGFSDVMTIGQFRVTSGSSDQYYVVTLNYNGSILWQASLGTETPAQPLAADVDGDGTDELVVCTNQKLRVFNYNGTIKWQSNTPCYSLIVSNMDADPELEIIYHTNSVNPSDATIGIVNGSNGTVLAGYPFIISNTVIRSSMISVKLSGSHTSNDILVPTSKGLKAYRGSDHQELWTINSGESCEYAGIWFADGEMVLAYQGSNLVDNFVTELYRLTDGGVSLDETIQLDIYPMPGTTPQQTFNFNGAPLSQADGGYVLAAADGGIFPFGDAGGYGSTGNIKLTKPMVGVSATPTREGYWLVAADGGIFPFGDAPGKGSTGNINLAKPMVGMASTLNGQGYWLVAADGGIFPFGNAGGYGSTGNIRLAQPVVGMERTVSGNGYWLVAADGGIFPFGDAVGYGSTGNIKLRSPVVGMARTASGNGYWLVAADGGIFPFGDAVGYGSAGNLSLARPIVGMAKTALGNGYWLVGADGGIFTYGDARYYGSTGDLQLSQPMVGIAN
ncbi:MAG: VCBS repeat-containing protein [Patescibacteria group bacterium]